MPLFPDADDAPSGDRPMTLGEHLDELRKRVFLCVLIAAAFCMACAFLEEPLLAIAMRPAYSVLKKQPGGAILATEVGEKFFTGMKLDLVAGLFFAAPLILYVLWGFVARGLHPREKQFVRIYSPVSALLFVAGCLFFYFWIQPLTLEFLLNYHANDIALPGSDPIVVETKLAFKEIVGFFLSMTLVTGLLFEMPLVMLFLQAIRICTWRTYLSMWRHFVVGLTVLAAVITPTGDMFTLAVFMAPVLVLFFGGIVVCRMMAPADI